MADSRDSSENSSMEMDTMISSTSSSSSFRWQSEDVYFAQARDVPWGDARLASIEDVRITLPVEPVDTRTVDNAFHSESDEEREAKPEQGQGQGQAQAQAQEQEQEQEQEQGQGQGQEQVQEIQPAISVRQSKELDDTKLLATRQTTPSPTDVSEEKTPVSWMKRYAGTISSAISSAGGMMKSQGLMEFSRRQRRSVEMSVQTKDDGSQTVRWYRISMIDPITDLLQKACESTGFAYAEVWLRQHRHEALAHGTEDEERFASSGFRRSKDVSRLIHAIHNRSARGFNIHDIHGTAERRYAPAWGNPATGSAGRASVDRRSNDGEGDGEPMAKRLRWSGHVHRLTEQFQTSAAMGYIGNDWNRQLDSFIDLALDKHTWYEKGKGFPGLAWARKELDWHDLSFMQEDDENSMFDRRVVSAKQIFDVSVGVPVLDPDTGHLLAIVMMYRAKTKKYRRPNQNWKALSSNGHLTDTLKELARVAYWSIQMQEAARECDAAFQAIKPVHVNGSSHLQPKRLRKLIKKEEQEEMNHTWTLRTYHFIKKYFKKFRGMPGAQIPPGHDWYFVFWTTFGTFVSILLLTGLNEVFKRISYSSNQSKLEGGYILVLLNSMAALAAMLFSSSSSPLVQPRNVLFGHLISAVVAISISYLSGNGGGRAYLPQWVATPLAPAVSTMIMAKTGLLHPPACAAAVIFLAGDPLVSFASKVVAGNDFAHQVRNMGWLFIVIPVTFDCVVI